MSMLRQRLRFLEEQMETAGSDAPGVSEEFLRGGGGVTNIPAHTPKRSVAASPLTPIAERNPPSKSIGLPPGSPHEKAIELTLRQTVAQAAKSSMVTTEWFKQHYEARAVKLEEEMKARNIPEVEAETLRKRLLYDGSDDGLLVGTQVHGMSATGYWRPCIVVQRILPTDDAATAASIKLHFEGFNSRYDEWVDLSRIKALDEGDTVTVETTPSVSEDHL